MMTGWSGSAGLEQVSEGQASATVSGWHGQAEDAHLSELELPGLFTHAERALFDHGQQRTAESLLATIATHSRLLMMDLAERDQLLSRVRAYLASRPETSGGEFTLPLLTGVLRARRLPAATS